MQPLTELVLLENPRGKRGKRSGTKRKRRASPAQLRARKQFAAAARARGKSSRKRTMKRNAPKRARRASKKTVSITKYVGVPMAHKRKGGGKRRFKRNPGFSMGNVGSGIVENLKDGAIGAGGIVVNKFLTKQAANAIGIDPKYNDLLELVIAAVGLPMLAKVLPPQYAAMVRQGSKVATAVAIYEFLKPYLPVDFQNAFAGEDYPQGYAASGYLPAGQPTNMPAYPAYMPGVYSSN